MMDLLWAVADNIAVPHDVGVQLEEIRERFDPNLVGIVPVSEMDRTILVHGVTVSLKATYRQSMAAGLLDKVFHDASVRGQMPDCYEWESAEYPKLLDTSQFRSLLEPLAALGRDYNIYADAINFERVTTVAQFHALEHDLDSKRSSESFNRLRTIGFMRDAVVRFLSDAGVAHGLSDAASDERASRELEAGSRVSVAGSGVDEGRGPGGLKTGEIRELFNGVFRESWSYSKWDDVFQTQRMKAGARTREGRAGSAGAKASEWNPVAVAIILVERYGARASALNRCFETHQKLGPWADIWTNNYEDMQSKRWVAGRNT